MVTTALLAGCVSNDTQRTQVEAVTVGAIAGALIGHATGNKTAGTLIGAAIGAGLGYAVGSEIAKRKTKYKTTEQFYDGQIKIAGNYSRELRTASKNLKRKNKSYSTQLARVEKQYRAGKLNQSQAKAMQASLTHQRQQSQKLIADAEKEIKLQEAVLADLRQKKGANDQRTRKLESKVNAMRRYTGDIQGEVQTLADYDASLNRVI